MSRSTQSKTAKLVSFALQFNQIYVMLHQCLGTIMLTLRDFFALDTTTQMRYVQTQLQALNLSTHALPSEQISVVIQGPIFDQTHQFAPQGITRQVLAALRTHLPKATLILSTWHKQPVTPLVKAGLVDVLIQSDDPGSTRFHTSAQTEGNLYNNGNRLIYSTQQGLAKVCTPYVMKIRSDLLLTHAFLPSLFGQFKAFDRQWRVVEQRIIGFPLFSLYYETGENAAGQRIKQPRPLHISDWAYFGLTTDIKQLFACPLAPEPMTSRWFATRPKPSNDIWPTRLWRYSPEQYIVANLAERTLGLVLAHGSQPDSALLETSRRFIANNFVVFDQDLWGMVSLKLDFYQDEVYDWEVMSQAGMYHFANWRRDYVRYCQKT